MKFEIFSCVIPIKRKTPFWRDHLSKKGFFFCDCFMPECLAVFLFSHHFFLCFDHFLYHIAAYIAVLRGCQIAVITFFRGTPISFATSYLNCSKAALASGTFTLLLVEDVLLMVKNLLQKNCLFGVAMLV